MASSFMAQWSRAPTRWVGLDLGSSSIKLIELEQTPTGVRVRNHLIQEFPSVQGPQPIDRLGWPHHLSGAAEGSASATPLGRDPWRWQTGPSGHSQVVGWLQAALKEFGAKDVHLAVGGPEVVIRRIKVPPMSKEELAEAVKWQVKDELPFPIHEAVLDFEVLGEVWDKDVKKLDILVAAASKGFVQDQITLIERAGSKVASVSHAGLALWQAVRSLSPERATGSVALVEIGAEQTHVAVFKDGLPRLARDLPIGSAHLTQAMAGVTTSERGEVSLDWGKAEQVKRRYGILTEHPQGTTEEGFPLEQLAALMRSILENLLAELLRLFDFYKVHLDETGISRVLLVGGGASLKHIQTFLSEGLAMDVELYDPLAHLEGRTQAMEGGPRLAVALGAALAHGQGPDLMPQERKALRLKAKTRWLVQSSVSGAVLVAGLVYLGLSLVAFRYDRQVRATQLEWAQLEPTYRHYMALAHQTKQVEGIVLATRGFLNSQPIWDGIFKELGQLIPPTIELTELSASSAESPVPQAVHLRLRGTAALTSTGGDGTLAQFLDALEASLFFRDVHLANSQVSTGAVKAMTFEIVCLLE